MSEFNNKLTKYYLKYKKYKINKKKNFLIY